IQPENLRELDSASIALPYGTDGIELPVQRFRDLLKSCTIMEDGHAAYLLLGIENQSDIHYAMPVRNMLYDSLQYAAQVQKTAAYHRREKDGNPVTSGEFLSGFHRRDRLRPVVTLVVCFSPESWDAPMSLHEMLDDEMPELLRYIPDYRINLIAPANLTGKSADLFHSELREVMLYLKHSMDKRALRGLLHEEIRFKRISRDAANLLNILAGMRLEYPTDEEEIDMCKAIDDMIKDAQDEVRAEMSHAIQNARNEERAKMSNAIDGMIQDAKDEMRAEMSHAIQNARDEERMNNIRNMMESLHLTAQQAMEALKIPASERASYLPQL
ncbi:MAG: Rpn family recombination-promoting nuclease/putative transposase, partial [Selenomonadaceae bacterium]|nr:Rpn family recombination-promoting nuclease/putative transposase [Selenomonadaceae bacterium]